MPWCCPDDSLMMHLWCTCDILMMQWWCTEDALRMHWVWYDCIGHISDLQWRFYGGRINGNKTWRRPTDRRRRRRQGEYRAICLWKMDWQSFAICIYMTWVVKYASTWVFWLRFCCIKSHQIASVTYSCYSCVGWILSELNELLSELRWNAKIWVDTAKRAFRPLVAHGYIWSEQFLSEPPN